MKKTFHGSVMLLAALALLASCGSASTEKSDDELWILAYQGGYGSAWLEDMASGFMAKYPEYEGKVVVDTSTSILDTLESKLKDGSDYDLFMSHDIPWQRYAAEGYLAELDDLFETEIDGFSGKTFEERLVEGAADLCKLAVDGETHAYKAPYTQGCGGFVYNVDLFKTNGWSVPTTYEELVTLCETIKNSGVTAGSRGTEVKAIAWAGKDRQYYWDYPVIEWWYQLAGKEKFDQVKAYLGPDASGSLTQYSNGYEMYNPDTYYKEFWQAYDMWFDLIADNDYCIDESPADALTKAQSNFLNGYAAMIPYAQWAKMELENTYGGTLPFEIAMMKTPKATSSSEDVNFMVGFGDSMIVPSYSTHQELAKKFLAYMATEEGCKTFVKDAKGSFLAFDYDDVDLSDLESSDAYIKSIHEKLSGTNINIVSTNPITYLTTNKVMPWVGNEYYYAKAAASPSDTSYQSSALGTTLYEAAKSGWSSWLKSAGLSD